MAVDWAVDKCYLPLLSQAQPLIGLEESIPLRLSRNKA